MGKQQQEQEAHHHMIDPEDANEGLRLRIERKSIPPGLMQKLVHEANDLRVHLDRDEWTRDPTLGSKNTPVIAAAAAGDHELIARLARYEKETGQEGDEFGAPGYYLKGPVTAKMTALRDARAAGKTEAAAAIAENLRAILSLLALQAYPVPRRRDLVIGGAPEESNTPNADGLSVSRTGNRWTPEERGEQTSANEAAKILAWALDWPNRAELGKGSAKGQLALLLGKRYTDTTDPEAWGLTQVDRLTLRQVVDGNVGAASIAASWVYGVRTAGRSEAWRVTVRRTSEGVQSVFFGPWANPNKPANAVTTVTADGLHVFVRPSFRKEGSAEGFRVWVDGNRIFAHTDQGGRDYSVEVLGGEVLWYVDIVGTDVRFSDKEAA